MKTTQTNSLKPVIIKVDKSLDKYAGQGYFKDKLDEANAIIKKAGLPDEFRKKSS